MNVVGFHRCSFCSENILSYFKILFLNHNFGWFMIADIIAASRNILFIHSPAAFWHSIRLRTFWLVLETKKKNPINQRSYDMGAINSDSVSGALGPLSPLTSTFSTSFAQPLKAALPKTYSSGYSGRSFNKYFDPRGNQSVVPFWDLWMFYSINWGIFSQPKSVL